MKYLVFFLIALSVFSANVFASQNRSQSSTPAAVKDVDGHNPLTTKENNTSKVPPAVLYKYTRVIKGKSHRFYCFRQMYFDNLKKAVNDFRINPDTEEMNEALTNIVRFKHRKSRDLPVDLICTYKESFQKLFDMYNDFKDLVGFNNVFKNLNDLSDVENTIEGYLDESFGF